MEAFGAVRALRHYGTEMRASLHQSSTRTVLIGLRQLITL